MNTLATLPAPPRIDWREFYERCVGKGPSYVGMNAVKGVEFHGRALDIGCGALNDTRFYLESGFAEVHAFDNSETVETMSLPLLIAYSRRFSFTRSTFDEFDYGDERYDLVTSNFALAFREKPGMRHLLCRIFAGMRPAAIFGGTFYGPRDCRKEELGFPAYTQEELELLFDPISGVVREIYLSESEKHYFRVFGRKSDSSL